MASVEALALVKRLRIRAEEIGSDLRSEILPVAERVGGFPLIAARDGVDPFAWRADWPRKLERQLADELDDSPRAG